MDFKPPTPDVRLGRRRLLWLPVPLGLAAWAGRVHAEDAAGAKDGATDWEAFLKRVEPLAKELAAADEPNESAYLHEVAALVARLTTVPSADLRPFPNLDGVSSGALYRAMPVSVLEFRVAPHGVIPLHDHAGYNGVMLGLEGEFRVKNYEPMKPGSPPRDESFELRQTSDRLVKPGGIATLSTDRDNFHEVVAGHEGGRALDIFTFLDRDRRGGFYDLDATPIDEERRIFRATPK